MGKTHMLEPAKDAPKLSKEEKDRLNKEFVRLESENFSLVCALEAIDGKMRYLMGLSKQIKKDGDETTERARGLIEKKNRLKERREEIVKKLGLTDVFSVTTPDEVI